MQAEPVPNDGWMAGWQRNTADPVAREAEHPHRINLFLQSEVLEKCQEYHGLMFWKRIVSADTPLC